MTRVDDSLSSVTLSYMRSSLPPGIAEHKGKLTIQLQEVEWHDTPHLLFGCSLCINWWGQSPDDNLILLIPNGCCPPVITAEVPLVSNMKQVSRYFKDMGKLDLCLVVGKKDTSGEEPTVSLGNFSLDVANLSEDVQIQGSYAVFDKTGVFLATVSLKLSISYFSNGADKKRTDWDESSLQVPKVISSYEHTAEAKTSLPNISSSGQFFDDLVTQRLNLLKERDSREAEVPAFPSAVMKTEDIGRSLTAEVRSSSAETLAKGYDNLGQRKQIVMDFVLSPRDLPSTDSDNDRVEFSPRKQMVMDFELCTPGDVSSSKGIDKFSPRKHLVLDVQVPSANRGHLQSHKHADQFSKHKQLVMDSDVPTRERGHLSFPFDATSPRIALMEGELPSEDGSSAKIPVVQHRFLTEVIGDRNNTASSEMPKGTKVKASRGAKSKEVSHSAPSRAKQREIKLNCPAKSRPLSAPAGLKVGKYSSHPASPSRVITPSKGKQLERKVQTTASSTRSAALPRFVGLPQGKQQRETKTLSRAKSPLSSSEFPYGRHKVKDSSPSPQKHRPIPSSDHSRSLGKKITSVISAVSTEDQNSLLGVTRNSSREQMVINVEIPSGNCGHTAFLSRLISSPIKEEQLVPRHIDEPLEEKETGRISPATQQPGSHSANNQSTAPLKANQLISHLNNTEPITLRVGVAHSSSTETGRSKMPLKQTLITPGQTPAIHTAAEHIGLELKEKATPTLSVEVSPEQNTKETLARTKPEQEYGIHLESEEHTIAEKQLNSGWHELAGNLASLPGEEPCSPNMSESKNEEIFYVESLSRLIARLEAFQRTLQNSSVSALGLSTIDPDRNKSSDLSERLKDVDEHIKSISRHLNQMLPEGNTDSDEPKCAQVVTLRHEKLPEGVTEVKNMKELGFRPAKIEQPPKWVDVNPKHLHDVRGLHHDCPKETAPMDIFLRSEAIRNFSEEAEVKKHLKSTTGSRGQFQPHNCCEVHGNPLYEGDKSREFNLCLILTVGKLVFEELVFGKLGLAQNSESFKGNAFGNGIAEGCSCSLTVSVPGLFHSTNREAEQSLSISPISLGWKEAHFGHRSQLNWSGLRWDTLKLWISQAMKVTSTLRWDSGNSLICEGSVNLGLVIDSMPKCYQTKLDLQIVPKMDSKLQNMYETRTFETSAAKIEIGITLLMEDMSGKPQMEAWMYVSVNSITGCFPKLKKIGGVGLLYLAVRAIGEDKHHVPFVIDYDDKVEGVQTWRLCKRRQADTVFKVPNQDTTLFIEVWRDLGGQDTRESTSETLIGLVKVPLEARQDRPVLEAIGKGVQGRSKKKYGNVNDKGVTVAEGNFSIWNRLKGVACGSVGVTVVRGSEDQMLNLQLQERAARIIQAYARCFTERIRVGKEECLLFAGKYNRFADEQFPDNYEETCSGGFLKNALGVQGGVTRHVLEVTVLHASDLPMTEEFKGADSARCEGAFIKYLFPCDGGPFYTQDMRWSRTIFFNASVHHGIILPSSENLETHIMKMKSFSKNDGNLMFELWGCFNDDLDKQTYLPNKLRLSNAGEPASWDMRREKYVNSVKQSAKGNPREGLLGTCSLLQKNLLHMISEKRRSFYSSPEVRKKFYLPVQMDLSHFQTYKRAPTLVVQVAYFILEIEDRKAHMVDTIFSGTRLHEDSLLEATLEIDILRATDLQTAVRVVEETSRGHLRLFENGLNSYVRYSLFPSNRQLELIYPPGATSMKANDFSPEYRWTGEVKIILNVQVLRELRTGKVCFEVWHHSYSHARTKFRPMVPSEESTATDICLGVATIPSAILIHNRHGINGWHDLSRKGVVVGAIKVAVCFKNWKVRPL